MAARKRNWQTNKTREKIRDSIKTGLLVDRLEKHALAQTEEERKATMLTPSQLKAGEILLQRTLPTLSSAEIVEQETKTEHVELLEQLKQLVGPEMYDILLKGKVEIKEETKIVHEQPEHAQ